VQQILCMRLAVGKPVVTLFFFPFSSVFSSPWASPQNVTLQVYYSSSHSSYHFYSATQQLFFILKLGGAINAHTS